jgi:hypothetical protein
MYVHSRNLIEKDFDSRILNNALLKTEKSRPWSILNCLLWNPNCSVSWSREPVTNETLLVDRGSLYKNGKMATGMRERFVCNYVITKHSRGISVYILTTHHPDDVGSKGLWNVGILPHNNMASQPRRPRPETSSRWKPQNSRTRLRSRRPEFDSRKG